MQPIRLAYAMCFAVDGSPCVFFEDLFDLHSTSQRWTHVATDRTALPQRFYRVQFLLGHD